MDSEYNCNMSLQPVISDIKQITLIGMSFYGDPFDTHDGWDEENEIGRLWKRFGSILSQNSAVDLNFLNQGVGYEVHIYHPETPEKGLFEVFVGMEVERIENVPVQLSVKVLPATQYAVFTLTGEEITSDWEMIIEGWLPASGYRNPYAYNFQYYDERFKGVDNIAESTLDVYIPIQKAT